MKGSCHYQVAGKYKRIRTGLFKTLVFLPHKSRNLSYEGDSAVIKRIYMEKNLLIKAIKAYPELSEDAEFSPFGSGHIHSTYLVKTPEGKYIIQEFNDKVFRYPDRIAANLRVIYDHLQEGMLPFTLPLPEVNQNGDMFTRIEGRLFRLFPFVEGVTKDAVNLPNACEIAARAFAEFVAVCLPIDARCMQDTIEEFHNLTLRFAQFDYALQHTTIAMNEEVLDLVHFYQQQRDLLEAYNAYTKTLPKRVTHNDTKINNLIYSNDLSVVNALIDLDTIMAGYVFYDFGDLVRTVACTEDESSQNWTAIGVDLVKYQALIEGFYTPLLPVLSDEELTTLPYGGEMMTCIMGLRFLTDYLNGNVYYHITYENQNLHRARNQQALLRSLREHRDQIQVLVNSVMGA